MKLTPLFNRIIFSFLELDERSAQGIIMLSGGADDRSGVQYGLVEAVGPKCEVAQVGDIIMLGPGSSYTKVKAPKGVSIREGHILVESSAEVAMTDEDMIYAVLKDEPAETAVEASDE